MVGPHTTAKRTLTVGEIAAMANVRPSAVSNWRNRHSDFPVPVESGAAGDVFDFDGVVAWLERHEKGHSASSLSAEQALWRLSDSLRGPLEIERTALLTMQLIYLRQRSQNSEDERASALEKFWEPARRARSATDAWKDVVAAVARHDDELRRVLELPVGVRDDSLDHAISLFASIDCTTSQWAELATSLLRRYQEAFGKRGAVLATPESVTRLVIRLLTPIRGTVYDPAAGFGMMLGDAWKERADAKVELVGQEVNEYNWRLGYLHLAIIGARFTLAIGDTLRDDRFRGLQADRVVLDPPIGQRIDPASVPPDERWRYGFPGSSSEWLWVQQLLSRLADDGVGVMITALGALSRPGTEASIRRGVIEADVLDAVVELPPGLLPATSTSVALLVFARDKAGRSGRVLFVDARQLGAVRRGKPRELTEQDIERITSAVASWRDGSFVDEPRFAGAATLQRIAEAKFDLSSSRYVGYESEGITEIDDEPLEERLARLRTSMGQASTVVDSVVRRIHAGATAFAERADDAWPTVRLGDLLVIPPRTGMRQDSDKPTAIDVPYIGTRLVSGGSGHLDTLPDEMARGDVRERLARRGDLLLVSRGIESNGPIRCATVRFDGEAAFSESLMRLRLDQSRVAPDFMRLYLTSRRGRALLSAVTTGTVIANLRPDALEEVMVPLPPLVVQHRIVAYMADVERGVSELSRLLGDATAVFDTLREGIAAGMLAPSS